MKEANPWIFRSLEKAAGQAEFDTIVMAAVASYGALRSPGTAKAREFADLVLPVWDRLKPETRRALGAALCHSTNVPRGIVEKLLAEPIEIAAPFLLSSPVLTDVDRRHLAQSRDSRLRRLARESAARDPSATPLFVREPLVPDEPETEKRPSAMAPPLAEPDPMTVEEEGIEPAAEEKPPYERGMAAAAVRSALRQIVRTSADRPAGLPTMADLLEAAIEGDAAGTLAALAGLASLDEPNLALLAEDESGERLAVAMKAIGMGDADAMTLMMMLKPRVGLDVAAFEQMKRYYQALKCDDCAVLLGLRRPMKAPALAPIFDDVERFRRPEPRATFGRRRTDRPDQKTWKT